MSDKRKVSTDALETLGTIIDSNQKRDAIHLAVEPVRASCAMLPGTTITIRGGVAFPVTREYALGIVDPFLEKPIKAGEWFWFVMFPRQVHSLRHVWTHPAFPDEVNMEGPSRDSTAIEESIRWVHNYASSTSFSYDEWLAIARDEDIVEDDYGSRYHNDGEYLTSIGQDAFGDIDQEVWFHLERIIGKPIPKHLRAKHFSCSC